VTSAFDASKMTHKKKLRTNCAQLSRLTTRKNGVDVAAKQRAAMYSVTV
jgi:hypothetical protein